MDNDKASALPIFYMYEDKDGWHKTDDDLTHEIWKHLALGTPLDTAGRSFYPQYEPPRFKSETKQATRVNSDGNEVARWFWCIRDHNRKHSRCIMLQPGKKCGVKRLARLRWDEKTKLWVLAEMPGKATDAEARQLDKLNK